MIIEPTLRRSLPASAGLLSRTLTIVLSALAAAPAHADRQTAEHQAVRIP